MYLNLNFKNLTKEDVNKAYIKIQKKIHPDIYLRRLSTLVNGRFEFNFI